MCSSFLSFLSLLIVCHSSLVHTGVYKPRIRCYDVNQLSMKFERCLDSESEWDAFLVDSLCIIHIHFQLSISAFSLMIIPK